MSHPHAPATPHGHGHPGGEGKEKKYLPRLIAWEVTRSCVLNCVHCRAAAKYGPYPGELDTETCYRFLDDVKSFSDPIIILTGGEPMMRPGPGTGLVRQGRAPPHGRCRSRADRTPPRRNEQSGPFPGAFP